VTTPGGDQLRACSATSAATNLIGASFLRATLDLSLTVPHQHLEARMNRDPTRALLVAYLLFGLVITVVGLVTIGVTLGIAHAVGRRHPTPA
jgi:hypothetical protein